MEAVAFGERYGGEVVTLSSSHGSVVIAVKGAQVLSWVPAGSSEVFWLSPNADLSGPKPVRGGIPICWPWFGPRTDVQGAPSHGFARTAMWRIVEYGGGDSPGPYLELGLETGLYGRSDWPYAASATLMVRLGHRLTVELRTTNAGREPFKVSEALHSYFRVGDIARVAISGLENKRFVDQLDNGVVRSERGQISIGEEVDRVYQDTPDIIVLKDKGLRRRIIIAKSGSLSTVVWNPWIEKSARLGDMGPDGYRQMVCVEPANAGKNAVTIAPGEHHRHQVEISVETA